MQLPQRHLHALAAAVGLGGDHQHGRRQVGARTQCREARAADGQPGAVVVGGVFDLRGQLAAHLHGGAGQRQAAGVFAGGGHQGGGRDLQPGHHLGARAHQQLAHLGGGAGVAAGRLHRLPQAQIATGQRPVEIAVGGVGVGMGAVAHAGPEAVGPVVGAGHEVAQQGRVPPGDRAGQGLAQRDGAGQDVVDGALVLVDAQ